MTTGSSTSTPITGATGAPGGIDEDGVAGDSATNDVSGDIETDSGAGISLSIDAIGGNGGNGGAGQDGQGGTDTPDSGPGYIYNDFGPGGAGDDGGAGGAGGDATAIYQASSITSDGGADQIMVSATGGSAGFGGQGGAGGSSGDGDFYSIYSSGTLSTDTISAGGSAGQAGAAGAASTASAMATDLSIDLDLASLSIFALAQGGNGGWGGPGGMGGGGGPPADGADGTVGGDGGSATATVSGVTATVTDSKIELAAYAEAANGGDGGDGASPGREEIYNYTDQTDPPTSSDTYTYADGGVGGNGGNGGDALAQIYGNTIDATGSGPSSPSTIYLDAFAVGGAGGSAAGGDPPGTPDGNVEGNADGSDGTGSLVLDGNTITMQGEGVTLAISLGVENPATSADVPLDTSNLTFSGNLFDGGGQGTLDLSQVLGGTTATIDMEATTLRLGDSTTSAIWGWSTVYGSSGADRIITGSGQETFILSSTAGNLVIVNPGADTDTVDMNLSGSTIDLSNFGGDLDSFAQVMNDATQEADPYNPTTYSGGVFLPTPDGGGVFLVGELTDDLTSSEFTFATACYCTGTGIRTARGDIPVEHLAIGDRVVTQAGETKPILWIGRRFHDAASLAVGGERLRPVLIRAGALGEGLPRRDLRVSPEHALFLDGLLVPARHLVNRVTILPDETCTSVHYYHIELAEHDIILAEGVPAETFVDCDNRRMFDNAAECAALKPAVAPAWRFCAERVEEGEGLAELRHRLARRAGLTREPFSRNHVAGPLIGNLECARPELIEGWAQDAAAPEYPVRVEILAGNAVIAQLVANRYRDDLRTAGLGSGRHAFRLPLSSPLPADLAAMIAVRRAADGMVLPGSNTKQGRISEA